MRVVVSQLEGIDVTPALPLAAGCLVATARADAELADLDYAIEVARRPVDQVVAAFADPELLGFSLYPWNAAYSLAVAEAARAAYPEATIVAGGPAVPRRPERARQFLDDQPAIDALVFAEGELAFRELVRARLTGADPAAIGGIALRGAPEHRFTAPPGRVHDFRDTASPFLDGTFDRLLDRDPGRFSMALLETNRGCPFSCTFCDWSLTKHVVELPLERVRAELDWVADRGFRHIMLADANFGIRRRDADIARYVAELRRRTGAPTSFYFYLTKNDHARNLETIEILQEAEIGCWVGLAVQDFEDSVLAAVKRDNIQTHESMKLRQICGDRGIPTFNELILGLPGQTYDSFARTVVQAMPALPRHDFVLFLCRMIDNTELGDPATRAEHAIETRRCRWTTSTPDWDPIVDEVQEVVVGTRDLPLADWQRAFRFSFLAAALYNLRLLRVVLQRLADLDVDRVAYIERLVRAADEAAPGTVYAELGAILDRYAASILASGPFVLPAGAGAPVYVDEALARAVLRRPDDFLDETAALSPRDPSVEEAFAYQALITPRWRQTEPRLATFEHDWPGYVAAGGTGAPLVRRPTSVRFTPPPFADLPGFESFASTHVGCIRGRLDSGTIEPHDPRKAVRLQSLQVVI